MVNRRQLGIRVVPAVAKTVAEMASELGLSISALGEELLQEALAARLGERLNFEARLEAIAAKSLATHTARVSFLASVAAHEAMATRLFAAKIAEDHGIDVVELMRAARAEAARRLQQGDSYA